MENQIITAIKTQIEKIDKLYVGYYPYDYQYIFNNMPACLIKLGDKTVSTLGHGNYDMFTTVQFILYITDTLSNTLQYEQNIFKAIITSLLAQDNLIIQINETNIQSGDINQYQTPSQTGYNANIIVRKISQSFTFRKQII